MALALRYRGSIHSREPIKHFSHCKWSIKIDDYVTTVGLACVRGTLDFIRPNSPVHGGASSPEVQEFQSLRIQLEGFERTKFNIKVDNRIKTPHEDHKLFPPSNFEDDSPRSPSLSPMTSAPSSPSLSTPFVFHFIRNGHPTDPAFCSVNGKSSEHSFPFEIELKSFPAAFSSPHGRIEYKLAVYANSFFCHDILLSRTPTFLQGYYPLAATNGYLTKPIKVTNHRTDGSPFFSKVPTLHATFNLSQRGYLPGESVPFQLEVINPGGDMIDRIQVSLILQVVYFAQLASKETTNSLAQKKISEVESKDTNFLWDNEIQLPAKLMPTFDKERRKLIDVSYFLEFIVAVEGSPELKGKSVIVIGTTWDWEGDPTGQFKGSSGSRRGSTDTGRRPSSSHHHQVHLPPAYVKFSRRPSVGGVHTAHEHEHTVSTDMDNWDDVPTRPRCNSNVM